MKILLVGEYYSCNLGDPLLCNTVKRSILETFPNLHIIPFDMSGKTNFNEVFQPECYSFLQKWFCRLQCRVPFLLNWNPLFRVVRHDQDRYLRTMCMLDSLLKQHTFDLVVFAGGSIFMDYFAGIIFGIVRRFEKLRVPVIFHACGMSRLTDDTAEVLQKALSSQNIRSISLRDSCSKFLSMFHTNAKVWETYDTALACSNFFPKSEIILADIGIGIIGLPEYYTFQKELLAHFLDTNLSWKIFTNGAPYDFEMATRILCDLNIPISDHCKYITPSPANCDELINTVTSFRRIISFRMHSQIVATSYGIPSYGFAWDNKVVEFYNKLGFSGNCSVPDSCIPWDDIFQAIDMDAQRVHNVASAKGKQSQDSLVLQIRSILNEVM